MTDKDQEFGRAGEAAAARFLEENGYSILAMNYRTPFGEIDIVARDRDTVVFVEVKSRKSLCFGTPKQSVDRKKQIKISKSALAYLKATGSSWVRARFDVVSIFDSSRGPEIVITRNAFELAYG